VLTFGVIAEGLTDQLVIRNILLGFFQDEEPVINPVQPLPATSDLPDPPGGWTRVFRSLKQGDPQKALQFNDYLVIQIDTDKQEELGFDVPRREGKSELSIPDQIARVTDRLRKDIDAAFYSAYRERILFAVAVDTIECWLLPLLYNDKKAEKTKGCLKAANAAIRKSDRKEGLSAGDTKKFPDAYDLASRGYRKRKQLMEHSDRNPSLELFIQQLDALQSRLTANQPVPLQGHDSAVPEDKKPSENTASDQPG
jgi:hypothetical protein